MSFFTPSLHSSFLRFIAVFCIFFSCTPLSFAISKPTLAGDAYFEANSSALTPQAIEGITKLANRKYLFTPETVIIVGHTDSKEKDALTLSRLRAKAVREQLMKMGAAPALIHTEGRGSELMITKWQKGSKEYWKNRRVEIEIVGWRQNSPEEHLNLGLSSAWLQPGIKAQEKSEDDSAMPVSPYFFYTTLQDNAHRQNFAYRLLLLGILENRSDIVALFAPELKNCDRFDEDFSNPYLLAVTLGREAMADQLAHCKPRTALDRKTILRLLLTQFCIVNRFGLPPVAQTAAALGWNSQQIQSGDLSVNDYFSCATLSPTVIPWFRAQSADLNISNRDETTALHHAIFEAEPAAVEVLLRSGADAKWRSVGTGATLLHIVPSARIRRPFMMNVVTPVSLQQRIWNLLIEHGADPTIADHKGNLPVKP